MSANDLLTARLERLIQSSPDSKDKAQLRKEIENLTGHIARVRGEIKQASRILKALSHPTRLTILKLLEVRGMCVCELTAILKATQPTISHHLSILRNMGLIEERREGKWIFYNIAENETVKCFQQIISHLCKKIDEQRSVSVKN
jgi:ArsR family transcriptional regulator